MTITLPTPSYATAGIVDTVGEVIDVALAEPHLVNTLSCEDTVTPVDYAIRVALAVAATTEHLLAPSAKAEQAITSAARINTTWQRHGWNSDGQFQPMVTFTDTVRASCRAGDVVAEALNAVAFQNVPGASAMHARAALVQAGYLMQRTGRCTPAEFAEHLFGILDASPR